LPPDFTGNLADNPDIGGLHHLVGAEIGLDENLEGIATFLFGGELADAVFKVGEALQCLEQPRLCIGGGFVVPGGVGQHGLILFLAFLCEPWKTRFHVIY